MRHPPRLLPLPPSGTHVAGCSSRKHAGEHPRPAVPSCLSPPLFLGSLLAFVFFSIFGLPSLNTSLFFFSLWSASPSPFHLRFVCFRFSFSLSLLPVLGLLSNSPVTFFSPHLFSFVSLFLSLFCLFFYISVSLFISSSMPFVILSLPFLVFGLLSASSSQFPLVSILFLFNPFAFLLPSSCSFLSSSFSIPVLVLPFLFSLPSCPFALVHFIYFSVSFPRSCRTFLLTPSFLFFVSFFCLCIFYVYVLAAQSPSFLPFPSFCLLSCAFSTSLSLLVIVYHHINSDLVFLSVFFVRVCLSACLYPLFCLSLLPLFCPSSVCHSVPFPFCFARALPVCPSPSSSPALPLCLPTSFLRVLSLPSCFSSLSPFLSLCPHLHFF